MFDVNPQPLKSWTLVYTFMVTVFLKENDVSCNVMLVYQTNFKLLMVKAALIIFSSFSNITTKAISYTYLVADACFFYKDIFDISRFLLSQLYPMRQCSYNNKHLIMYNLVYKIKIPALSVKTLEISSVKWLHPAPFKTKLNVYGNQTLKT